MAYHHLIQATHAALISAIKAYAVQHGIDETAARTADVSLLASTQKQTFGDFSTNAALIFSKVLAQNPRTIAAELVLFLKDDAPLSTLVSHYDIAGPGFVNIFCTGHACTQEAQALCARSFDKTFSIRAETGETHHTYNIEFVSANPTGPLHLGHGRNGIIGNVLARILNHCAHRATQEFYVNDAGVQITKLGESLKIRYLQELDEPAHHPLPEDGYQGEYLIEIARDLIEKYGEKLRTKEIDYFASEAKNRLLAEQKETLERYGITFDVWFSEKTLHESGKITQTLELLEQLGHTYTTEDGAVWFASTKFGDDKDRVIRKSSGELTYVAADLAYLRNKKERGFDRLIMVLGQDHHGYAGRMKAAMTALGYDAADLDIIFYQLVTIKEGGELVRMSKRRGKIVSLDDIISTVGPDVARFFYLNKKADAHLEFDIDLALKKSEENPVYYLQYAFVRIGSILRKAMDVAELRSIHAEHIGQLDQSERLIIKKVLELEQLLHAICSNYHTHLLAYYTVELAQLFHAYYTDHRVIDQDDTATSQHRLAFIRIIGATLELCFDLMGISKPAEM